MTAEEFRDLVACQSEQKLADFLKVDLKTIRRWKSGKSTPPHSAIIALRCRLNGDLSALVGKDWEYFHFGSDGLFYMPGWKYGWSPGDLRALFFTRRLAQHWEREAKRLEQELKALRESAWAAAKVMAICKPYYGVRSGK